MTSPIIHVPPSGKFLDGTLQAHISAGPTGMAPLLPQAPGVLSRSRRSRCHAKPRYGYMIEDGKMVPDPEEQAVIEKIRTMIAEDPDVKIAAIMRKLTRDGVRIRSASTIYHAQIKRIIEDNNLRGYVPLGVRIRSASTIYHAEIKRIEDNNLRGDVPLGGELQEQPVERPVPIKLPVAIASDAEAIALMEEALRLRRENTHLRRKIDVLAGAIDVALSR